MRSRQLARLATVVVALALLASGCGGDDSTDSSGDGVLSGSSFAVGSKEFTEQLILGQITLQVLRDAGANVTDKTGLVGFDTVRGALLSGDIDMYWEYTGTGWINHLGNTEPVKGDREQYDAVAKADLNANGVTWLEPAPFNNTYAITTSAENAEAFKVSRLSDLTVLQTSNPADFTLCAAAEFLARDDGLPGLQQAYGFNFGNKVSELELGLVYASVDKGDPCKFGEAFATDGRIAALDLVVLDDDKNFFASYLPALTVRRGVTQTAQLGELLAPVAAALTTEAMQGLNAKVDVDGEQPEDVARDFLEEKNLIGS